MNSVMEQFDKTPDKKVESSSELEEMVSATKISTVFPDQKVLERIADRLLIQGIISGFHVDRVVSGYIYAGNKTTEDQYSLEILLDEKADGALKEKIRRAIAEEIGRKWDVPAIEEEAVRVNRQLLGFIKRAEVEHGKYVRERNTKLAVTLAALLAVSGMVGTLVKRYTDERERQAVATEQAESYKRLLKLEQNIERQRAELDAKISAGKPLTAVPTDMAATESYEETGEIIQTIREAQEEMRRLIEAGKKK